MKRTAQLFLATAGLLSFPAAHATPVTYIIATTQVFIGGPVSGTLSGTGTTLASYDIAASNGLSSLTFDSSLPGQSGVLKPYKGITLVDGTPLEFAFLFDAVGDSLQFSVTGDFTNGFVFDSVGTLSNIGPLGGLAVVTSAGTFAEDNVSLTAQAPSATPEPSSLILLASGLTGLVVSGRRRNRKSSGSPSAY